MMYKSNVKKCKNNIELYAVLTTNNVFMYTIKHVTLQNQHLTNKIPLQLSYLRVCLVIRLSYH